MDVQEDTKSAQQYKYDCAQEHVEENEDKNNCEYKIMKPGRWPEAKNLLGQRAREQQIGKPQDRMGSRD